MNANQMVMVQYVDINLNEKSRQKETQTLRTGCSKTESKNFGPTQTPFPGARDG